MRKKIVHVINNLNRGGAETLLLNILIGVKERLPDVEILVLILEKKITLLDDFQKNGINVEIVDVYGLHPVMKVHKLRKKLAQIKPDIVHTHLLYSDRVGQVAAFLAGVKKRVSTLHSLDKPKIIKEKLELKMSSFFTQEAIAVSESVKRFNIENKLYPSSKLRVIYNAPSFTITHRKDGAKVDVNRNRFVSLGRLHHLKEYSTMINAVKIAIDHGAGFTLDVFGVGDLETQLTNQIIELGLSEVVFLRGLTNSVQEKLFDSDYYISASSIEGQPLSVIEALSVGLPFVVTSIPAHIEMLEYEEYPYLAEPKDPQSLADAIVRIVKDENYGDLSKYSLKLAQKYSKKNMHDEYSALYTSMLDKK